MNRRDSSNRTDREMTIPMIIKKIDTYNSKLEIINKRIRVPNLKKIELLTRSYVKYQLNLL